MPHPKRQSSTNRKRTTERQIVLARRSRSIKASLLKVLSLDLVALYHADQVKNSDATTPRNSSHSMPYQSLDFHNSTELHPASRSIPSNPATSVRSAEPSISPSTETELKQAEHANSSHHSKVVSRPASQESLATGMARCFAFLLGILIRCTLVSYLQPFAIVLSGSAIAISGISILIVVVFTPWKKKLLWNLACLLGGLLVAVLVL